MQDPSSAYYQAMMKQPQFPEQEQLKCPRCDSTNTKFCYYNNYNLSQPRHFCKSCRRYWTKGGTLRNIPVGGSSRKSTKRPGSSSIPKKTHVVRDPHPDPARMIQDSASTAGSRQSVLKPAQDPTRVYGLSVNDQDMKVLDMGGSFSSLLATSNMQLGGILDGLNANGWGLKPVQTGEFGQNFGSDGGSDHNSGQEPVFGVGGDQAYCWSGSGSGWPDLAINTPGSSFQ